MHRWEMQVLNVPQIMYVEVYALLSFRGISPARLKSHMVLLERNNKRCFGSSSSARRERICDDLSTDALLFHSSEYPPRHVHE